MEETRLARALRERAESGRPLLDLTASNPTHCGFLYDEAAILSALADSDALSYDPDPRGMLRPRAAVCRYYAERGAVLRPEQVFLTTGTSEAYGWLFRLLCDAGDEVLIAQPGYPLFDFLAQLEDVRLVPYPLFYDYGWQIDFAGLRERITPQTRAIAVVHPNNPTGHFTRAEERRELEAICAERGLALIVDEVFLDYSLSPGHAGSGRPRSPGSSIATDAPPRVSEHSHHALSFVTGPHPALTFVLSGISKIAALPQMKAAWIAALGPQAELREAMARLEVVADTFLSMNAPVQCALASWLTRSSGMQQQIRTRTLANLRNLDQILLQHPGNPTSTGSSPVTRLEVEAGWYAVLRVPALEPDEDLAVRLAAEQGVSVHPGYFFGFNGNGWLVVSLLTPELEFRQGIGAICALFAG